MVPAFGFSVGDFVAAAGLIAKISKAIRDKGGASTEFQQLQQELEALARTLRYLEALESTDSNAAHVNAIRGMALTCRIPLQAFLESIEKFERTMGAHAAAGSQSLKGFGRKSQWALSMNDEVARPRAAVGAKVLSINLLLATHSSESLSRIETQAQESHATLLASVLNLRAGIARTEATVQATEHALECTAKKQERNTKSINNAIGKASRSIRKMSDVAHETNTSMICLRNLGSQLLQLVQILPLQFRAMLDPVLKNNMEMYAVLREVQNILQRSPTYDPADTFLFEDVLGRSRRLPYEYFRHSKVFKAFVETDFKGLPGEQHVMQDYYVIEDTTSGRFVDFGEDGRLWVYPGTKVRMSVLIETLRAEIYSVTPSPCPRQFCNGQGRQSVTCGGYFFCDVCNKQYLPLFRDESLPDVDDQSSVCDCRQQSKAIVQEQEQNALSIFRRVLIEAKEV